MKREVFAVEKCSNPGTARKLAWRLVIHNLYFTTIADVTSTVENLFEQCRTGNMNLKKFVQSIKASSIDAYFF